MAEARGPAKQKANRPRQGTEMPVTLDGEMIQTRKPRAAMPPSALAHLARVEFVSCL